MRKIVFCILGCFILSSAARATGQEADRLVYKNKKYALFSNPLEAYYKDEDAKPAFRPRENVLSSTANWRGYVATWEITEGRLYLVGIESWICNFQQYVAKNCKKADLKELFRERYVNGKVLANWFSGELRVPDGKLLEYVHMGYGSVYEREIILTIDAGIVTKEAKIDNRNQKRPSNLEIQQRELEKLEQSPVGNKKTIEPR